LITFDTTVHCLGASGTRTIPLSDFITDAYTTALTHDELVTEVEVKIPPKGSGGAYLAFKRSAPVYPSASAGCATHLAERCLSGCRDCSWLRRTDRHPRHRGETALRGQILNDKTVATAAEAARSAADPQSDMRGSVNTSANSS
jgi:aerobic carbon-monoxide dehydrogenase medium subunit